MRDVLGNPPPLMEVAMSRKSTRAIVAELAALPRIVVPLPEAQPKYRYGVYLSGIGRLKAHDTTTGAIVVIRTTGELLAFVAERSRVDAVAKLSGLRSEALIAEDSASKKTRPQWLTSLAMIEKAMAVLSEQPAAVREVA
jgi:hypothetical protein